MRTMVRLVAALAALFVSIPAAAETRAGVLGCVNLATVDFDPHDPDLTLRSKPYFGAGAVLEVRFGKKLSLQLEPLYLGKGGKIEIRNFFGEDVASALRLSYIELPFLLKFSKPSGRVRPYLVLGPSVGYRVGAKIKNEVTGEEENIDDEDLEKWDVSLGGGGGLSVPVGSGVVFLEGLYTWGLTNLNKDEAGDDAKLRNRGVQVLAGVTFLVGRR